MHNVSDTPVHLISSEKFNTEIVRDDQSTCDMARKNPIMQVLFGFSDFTVSTASTCDMARKNPITQVLF